MFAALGPSVQSCNRQVIYQLSVRQVTTQHGIRVFWVVWPRKPPSPRMQLGIQKEGDGTTGGASAEMCDNPLPSPTSPSLTLDQRGTAWHSIL